jgi:lipopolysaccharide export system protein LptA
MMRPFIRPALTGFTLAAAALLGLQQINAQAVSGHNSNAPVNVDADRIELQDKQNRVTMSGNVIITQGNLRLTAARTTIDYLDTGALEIQRLNAVGGVTVTRGNESARGAVAVYDFNRRLIVMSGGVSLKRGSDTVNGGRLTIDLNSGLSSVDGRASPGTTQSDGDARVSGTFTVPE